MGLIPGSCKERQGDGVLAFCIPDVNVWGSGRGSLFPVGSFIKFLQLLSARAVGKSLGGHVHVSPLLGCCSKRKVGLWGFGDLH